MASTWPEAERLISAAVSVLPWMDGDAAQFLVPNGEGRSTLRRPWLARMAAWRLNCPSEAIFALGVSALWVLLYNEEFWQRTASVMWQPSWQGVLFLTSLAVFTVALQSILLMLTPSRMALRTFASLLFVIAAIGSYFVSAYGAVLNKDMLRNVAQTDPAEVGGLMSPALILYVLVLGVVPAMLVWRVNLPTISWKARLKQRAVFIVAALLASLAGVFVASSNYAVFFRQHKPIRYALVPLMPVASAVSLGAETWKGERGSPLLDQGGAVTRTAASGGKPLVLFIVVGETARGANFQLGGYERATNPQLSTIENLVYFDNTASCATSTAVSLPCLFSQFPRATFDVKEADNYTNVLDSMVKGGFQVEWRDNNSGCKGVCARIPAVEYKAPQSNNELCPNSYCYDEIMLTDLADKLRSVRKDTAIVFHQVGSHGPAYAERYPLRFEIFKPVCNSNRLQSCTRQEIVNAYDNSIAYTDFVLARQIELLRAAEDRLDSLLIYVSDHGESLGEKNIYLHGMPYAFAPVTQKQVPLLMWTSKGYRERTGLNMQCLRKAASEYFSHDNIYHTVLGAAQLRNAQYDPTLDMLKGCRST